MAQINARADTAAVKPMFRSAFKKRRCLIVADGYFEWKKLDAKSKQPFLYQMKSGKPFAFAGLWETWKGEAEDEPIQSCAILATDANELASEVHDRVILAGDDAAAWIDPGVEGATSPPNRTSLPSHRSILASDGHPAMSPPVTLEIHGIAAATTNKKPARNLHRFFDPLGYVDARGRPTRHTNTRRPRFGPA